MIDGGKCRSVIFVSFNNRFPRFPNHFLPPMLSNKFVNSEKITLVDNGKIITNEKEIAKVLNDIFSNIIKTLNIPQKIILTHN